MDQFKEFEGKSLEEAVERASDSLGRPVSELKYEVIENAKRGFFGLGKRVVRIRVIGDEPFASSARAAERPPAAGWSGRVEKGPRARSGGQSQIEQSQAEHARAEQAREARIHGRAGEQAAGERGRRHQSPGRAGAAKGNSAGNRERGVAAGNAAPAALERGTDRYRQTRGGRRGGGRLDADRPRGGEHRTMAPKEESSGGEARPLPPFRLSDDAPYSKQEAVRLVAGHILRMMNLDLRAKLRDREGTVVLELGGNDAPALLEHDGEALEALQHLLNKILGRDERFDTRVVVDCEGFRSQRDEEIAERAKRGAEEALLTGQPVHLEGLNPYERRVVHLALADQKGVRTFSTGEGAVKRLTIEPVVGDVRAEEA
jgi:spoIIIJ-associated protein